MRFIAWHQERGTLSRNWEATWTLWWGRWRDHTKAKPRVELDSNRPDRARAPIGYSPTEAEFDRAAVLYAKSASKWSSQLGPEPGHRGCKCPPDILRKHGIDPETGLKVRSE